MGLKLHDMLSKFGSIDSKTILKVLIIFAEKKIESSEYKFNKNITYTQILIYF